MESRFLITDLVPLSGHAITLMIYHDCVYILFTFHGFVSVGRRLFLVQLCYKNYLPSGQDSGDDLESYKANYSYWIH